MLRHENAVLRRQIGRVRYELGDRLWLAAMSRLVPRRRWGEVFAVTPVGAENCVTSCGLIANTSSPRRRGTSRGNAANHSRSPDW